MTRRPLVALAGLWLAICGTAAVWLTVDRRPPEWDHANHLERAVDCYRNLRIVTDSGAREILEASSFYPPLATCAAGALYLVFPITPLTAQVVMMGFLALALACVYGLGRRLADVETGLWAAFLLATAPFVVFSLTNFQLDLPLAAMVALTLYATLPAEDFGRPGWSLALGAAVGFRQGAADGSRLSLARHPGALRALLADPEQEPALHATHLAGGRARRGHGPTRAPVRVAPRRRRGRAGGGGSPGLDDALGAAATTHLARHDLAPGHREAAQRRRLAARSNPGRPRSRQPGPRRHRGHRAERQLLLRVELPLRGRAPRPAVPDDPVVDRRAPRCGLRRAQDRRPGSILCGGATGEDQPRLHGGRSLLDVGLPRHRGVSAA